MIAFSEILAHRIRTSQVAPRTLAPGECASKSGKNCRLCYAHRLEYEDELRIKNEAMQEFWKKLFPTIPLQPLIASPRGREYRVISKRRVFAAKNDFVFGLIDLNENKKYDALNVLRCAIEPKEHTALYDQVENVLRANFLQTLSGILQYVIIKGNYDEQWIILNVAETSPKAIHEINQLSKLLSIGKGSLKGLSVLIDAADSKYYTGSNKKTSEPRWRTVFGNKEIFHQVMEKKFLYHPLSFSQVNLSAMENLLLVAERLLQPNPQATLYDLYCGYGLFALCFADKFQRVVGVEMSLESIRSAIDNAKRQHVSNDRFITSKITHESIRRVMRTSSQQDIVILDPPRNGTLEGVIETIAAHSPRRVLHIFCNLDIIVTELERWKRSRYRVLEAIPLDNFPGTPSMELMVLLEPED